MTIKNKAMFSSENMALFLNYLISFIYPKLPASLKFYLLKDQ